MSCIDQLYRKLCSRIAWPAYKWIDKNWIHLKRIINILMETDDFNYVVNTRYENFIKYKINAMDDSNGKLIRDGNEILSVIGRNLDIIKESFRNTKMDSETENKFFEVYSTYAGFSNLIDR